MHNNLRRLNATNRRIYQLAVSILLVLQSLAEIQPWLIHAYRQYGLAIVHTLATLGTLALLPPHAPPILIPITWGASLATALVIHKGISRLI